MGRYDDMVVFHAISRVGTISGAADELGVSPSAVSRRLKALESRLGVELIKRNTRQLTLSPAGDEYLRGVVDILKQLEGVEDHLQSAAAAISGPIKLSAPVAFGMMVLPDLISSFLAEHPGVEFDVYLSDEREDLAGKGFDVAIRIGRPGQSSLIARKLHDFKLLVCWAPSLAQKYADIDLASDWARLPFCAYTNKDRPDLLRYRDESGTIQPLPVNSTFRSNSGDLLVEMGMRGLGVVMLLDFIAATPLANGDLLEVVPGRDWGKAPLYAVYPPTSFMPSRQRAFLDHLATNIKSP